MATNRATLDALIAESKTRDIAVSQELWDEVSEVLGTWAFVHGTHAHPPFFWYKNHRIITDGFYG